MKKILLPTDFSENAQNAAEYAFKLFGFKDVKYILFHAFVEPTNSADMLVSLNDILQKQTKEDLADAYNVLVEKYPESKSCLEAQLEFDNLNQSVKNITEKDGIDYVVIGTKGASGLKKTLLGSNASSLIKKIKCPIIVVPQGAVFAEPKQIAFATDYKLIGEEVLQPLMNLVKANNAHLMVVNINKTATPVMKEHVVEGMNLGHLSKDISQSFYTFDSTDLVEGLRQFIHSHKIDILALVATEHSLYKRMFEVSLTKEMATTGQVPLLVLHA